MILKNRGGIGVGYELEPTAAEKQIPRLRSVAAQPHSARDDKFIGLWARAECRLVR